MSGKRGFGELAATTTELLTHASTLAPGLDATVVAKKYLLCVEHSAFVAVTSTLRHLGFEQGAVGVRFREGRRAALSSVALATLG